MCLLALLVPAVQAQPNSATEYELKAALITKFACYTEWPSNTYTTGNEPIVIGILGEDPFGKYLVEYAKQPAGEHSLQVRHLSSPSQAADCQVVFISRSESRHEAAWLAALSDKPVVTVGESGHTLERGGIIEFQRVDNRVRFDVNLAAMAQAGVKFGSGMLQSALHVLKSPEEAQ
jgi:hypothetical protein